MINVRKAFAAFLVVVGLGTGLAVRTPATAEAVSACSTATTRSLACSAYFAKQVTRSASVFGSYNASNLALGRSLWHAGAGLTPSKYFGYDVATRLKNYQSSRGATPSGALTDFTLSLLVNARPATAASAGLTTSSQLLKADKAVRYAYAQLGDPYRYGAAGPDSFDCSGLTSASWKSAGTTIPRTASGQMTNLKRITKSSLRPGDLVIFYSGGHTSVYIGAGKIIHSPHTGTVVQVSAMSSMPFAAAVRVTS